ncbi:hypothetical protein HCH_01974 [Hahella chejuensis KCTC 2396]|uniref:Uncharacterized protein n=1 Tax=Hahella chejuensis (strain KCTC 2396) TaxID=349521 RepID=Q2SKL7_HAHCH|nr:hypothetical protein [Hahella chejuensis]ABC28807.1 hypothetical protein HCH_01974 [Hahella chejuensis KCTC 2396]
MINKLRNETKYPLSLINKAVDMSSGYEEAKLFFENEINKNLDVIKRSLCITEDEAVYAYEYYGLSLERCIDEERKKSLPVTIETKIRSISSRLKNGDLLVGEVYGLSEDCYYWVTAQKKGDEYIVCLIGFRKSDVENCLDLIYSDAVEFLQKIFLCEDDAIKGIEEYVDIFEFDTRKAYEKFPL